MKQLHVKMVFALFLAGTTIPSFSGDRKTYRLEFNLKENRSYKQHTRVVMETCGEDTRGKTVNVDTDTRTEVTYLVKSVDKDLITMDFVYDNIRSITNANIGDIKMETDSDKPLPEEWSAPLEVGTIYKAITGIPVSVTMTKKGRIQSVNGTDKLSEAILGTIDSRDLPTSTEQFALQLTSQIMKQYNEVSIMQKLEQNLAYLPDNEVAIGDTWDIAMDLQDPYIVTSKMEMKLVDVTRNIATIEGNGTVSTPGEVVIEQPQGTKLRLSLAGTQSGIIKIDLDTGFPVDAMIIVEMEGESESISISEKDGKTETKKRMTPMTVKSTVNITN